MSFWNRLLSWRRFSPYIASDEGYDPAYFANTLTQLRAVYAEKGWADSFDQYEEFIHTLRDIPNTTIVPLKELMSAPTTDRKVVALRYDIDADPVTGVRLARFNARYGMCGSFYILHSAYYYGILLNGCWHRNAPMLRDWVQSFVVAGAEVGLHVDPLTIYTSLGIDGAGAVRTELQYLRDCGAKIEGVVAHNSFAVYGAENFEIFKNRTVWSRTSIPTKFGKAPLGVLGMAELGISYEGNFASAVSAGPTPEAQAWLGAAMAEAANSEPWMQKYLHENPCYRRAYDGAIWHHGGGKWTVAVQSPRIWQWKTSLKEAMKIFAELPVGKRISIVMHPVGFSKA